MIMRLALGQMQIKSGDFQHNLDKATLCMQNAAQQNADMLLFPELWSSGYDLERAPHWAARNAALFQDLAYLARQYRLWIGGSVLEEDQGRIYNTFVLTSAQGMQHTTYRKIHLFGLMDEDRFLHPGRQPVCTNLPWAACGLAICYDLRFPELFRKYALLGAHLILLVAQWPLSRIDHWKTLLCARAIENQCFIAAVNAVSETLGGNSMLIDPWGSILAQASSNCEEVISADLDFDQVDRVRHTMPALKDRRPETYS